jgi:hypothetical protein
MSHINRLYYGGTFEGYVVACYLSLPEHFNIGSLVRHYARRAMS